MRGFVLFSSSMGEQISTYVFDWLDDDQSQSWVRYDED